MMGLFLDEIIVGRTIALGTHVFTEDAINRFREKFAPVPMHLSEQAAATGLFGKRVAVGLHICCGWMTCFVAANKKARDWMAGNGMALPEIGPSPGLENLQWPNPVSAGDSVAYDVTVTAKRELKSRKGWGVVTCRCEGRTSAGVPVMLFDSWILVQSRVNRP